MAIVPGYITIFFWSRNKMWRGLTNDLQTVLKALAVSAALQVAIAPYTLILLYPVRNDLLSHPWTLVIWSIVLVLFLPYAVGTLVGKVTDWLEVKARRPKTKQSRRMRLLLWLFPEAAPPSVWDSIFSQGIPDGTFVILEFRDGSRVAGVYAKDVKDSEVFVSPEPHGIYLLQEWTVDDAGDIGKKIPSTEGVMVTDVSDLRCVRFLRGGQSDRNEASPAASAAARPATRAGKGTEAAYSAAASGSAAQEVRAAGTAAQEEVGPRKPEA